MALESGGFTLPVITIDMLKLIAAFNPSLGITLNLTERMKLASIPMAGSGAISSAIIGVIFGHYMLIPVYMLLGSFIGFSIGIFLYKNVSIFKPLSEVLKELTAEERDKLIAVGQTILLRQSLAVAHTIFENYKGDSARYFISTVYEASSRKKLSYRQEN